MLKFLDTEIVVQLIPHGFGK